MGRSNESITAFWFMGILNRSTFIVMLAYAKEISEGGTALVYIMNTLPRLIGNASVPYALYLFSYDTRMYATAALFASSYSIVGFFAGLGGYFSSNVVLYSQLLGVGIGALGYGIGESSLLALGGKFDSGKGKSMHLTAFSSGSGLAGLVGYLWKAALNDWIGLSITTTLFLGNVLAFSYGCVFYLYLADKRKQDLSGETDKLLKEKDSVNYEISFIDINEECKCCGWSPLKYAHMDLKQSSLMERLYFVSNLWPYMVPMFVVYYAEYGLQSGAWAAIGFPVDSEAARISFYTYSNWVYQAGTFLSRSSGTIYEGNIVDLWIMAGLQVFNLMFFILTGIYQFFYNWYLLLFCFSAGILGGAVYVNAYTRINKDVPSHQKEFALASASIADSFGTLLADSTGLFIQSCLYKVNNIPGATVTCPF